MYVYVSFRLIEKMSIHVLVGPMFSGKTSVLLQKLQQQKQEEYVLLKYELDTSSDQVISHSGLSLKAQKVQKLKMDGSEMFGNDRYRELNTIAIDGGHFFNNLADCCHQWVLNGKNVIVTALQTGIYMEPIKQTCELLALANSITLMHAVCHHCSMPAIFTYRTTPLSTDEPNITDFISGSSAYIAVCRRCYHKRLNLEVSKKLGLFSSSVTKVAVTELLQFDWKLVDGVKSK